MPLFITVHKWKPGDDAAIKDKWPGEIVALANAVLQGKAPGIAICAFYDTFEWGEWVVWRAPSKEDLERLFEQYAPSVKKVAEFALVSQLYPPTMECVVAMARHPSFGPKGAIEYAEWASKYM